MSGNFDLIIKRINGENPKIRYEAIKELSESKNMKKMEVLIELLKHSDPMIRANAARALGKTNSEVVVPYLLESLDDPHFSVKVNAAWALGKLKDKRAINKLISLIDKKHIIYTSNGDGIGNNILNTTTASETQLEDAVVNCDIVIKAIEALGEIGDPRALPALYNALEIKEHDNIRCSVCKAMGAISDLAAVNKLIEATKDPFWYVRRDAAIALGKLRDSRSVESLRALLNDQYEEVKQAALNSLMQIGKPASYSLLKSFVKKPGDQGLRTYFSFVISEFTYKITGFFFTSYKSINSEIAKVVRENNKYLSNEQKLIWGSKKAIDSLKEFAKTEFQSLSDAFNQLATTIDGIEELRNKKIETLKKQYIRPLNQLNQLQRQIEIIYNEYKKAKRNHENSIRKRDKIKAKFGFQLKQGELETAEKNVVDAENALKKAIENVNKATQYYQKAKAEKLRQVIKEFSKAHRDFYEKASELIAEADEKADMITITTISPENKLTLEMKQAIKNLNNESKKGMK